MDQRDGDSTLFHTDLQKKSNHKNKIKNGKNIIDGPT